MCIGYVCPEAAAGGPLGLVRDGDRIRVDAAARRMDLLIEPAELERRRATWTPRRRAVPLAGALEKYANQVGSAHLGAVTHSGNLQWEFEAPVE
jgi:dihydroxy-acid dehydratase